MGWNHQPDNRLPRILCQIERNPIPQKSTQNSWPRFPPQFSRLKIGGACDLWYRRAGDIVTHQIWHPFFPLIVKQKWTQTPSKFRKQRLFWLVQIKHWNFWSRKNHDCQQNDKLSCSFPSQGMDDFMYCLFELMTSPTKKHTQTEWCDWIMISTTKNQILFRHRNRKYIIISYPPTEVPSDFVCQARLVWLVGCLVGCLMFIFLVFLKSDVTGCSYATEPIMTECHVRVLFPVAHLKN